MSRVSANPSLQVIDHIRLSVPAIWNQKEKVDMQTAALKAGFRQTRNGEKSASMHLVAEPEAAAFGVWSTPEFSKPKTGETFVGIIGQCRLR